MTAVFVVTKWWAVLVAGGAMAGLLLVAHVLIVTGQGGSEGGDNVSKRRRGVKALVMGADGRASTSKVQAVLWTFSVFAAFAFLLVWGRSWGCGGSGLDADEVAACAQAARDRMTFAEVTGRELQPDYYVLLGFPLGVAVAARALTTSKVASGTVTKMENTKDQGVTQGLREVISNDRGETDLIDFQYFAFNLLTLAFFWTEFLTNPAGGLPDLPATLIGLSGLSAAAYTTRKALEVDAKPAVSAVIPRRIVLADDAEVVIVGTGFGVRGGGTNGDGGSRTDATAETGSVKLDGTPLGIRRWTSTRIEAVVTVELAAALAQTSDGPAAAELVVDVPGVAPSDPFTVELAAAPAGRAGSRAST